MSTTCPKIVGRFRPAGAVGESLQPKSARVSVRVRTIAAYEPFRVNMDPPWFEKVAVYYVH